MRRLTDLTFTFALAHYDEQEFEGKAFSRCWVKSWGGEKKAKTKRKSMRSVISSALNA